LPRTKRAPNAAPTHQAMFQENAALTLSEIQYRKLRARILSVELPPGSPVSELELVAQEGISRTPIREAILGLAREKLVEVVPKSGTFVGRIPISGLPEALIARRALEGTTARAAAKVATRSQVLGLQALIEKQRELKLLGDAEKFHVSDEELHEQIAIIAKLPGLWKIVQQIKLQMDRFRRLTLPEPGRISMVIEEHSVVVNAIGQKNPDKAYAGMEVHLSGLQLHIENVVNAYPDYFIHDADLNDLPQI
jgi:DNA-binding GntR family transcriptional regulator